MPLISVYMPTYNRLQLLKRSLESVLNQTFKDFEIVIVDDGSTDGSREFLEDISRAMPNIVFIRNDSEKHGACRCRNIAISHAQGRYVTGLDDDDYFHPNRLETLLRSYDPRNAAVASNYFVVDKTSVRRNSYFSRHISSSVLFTRNAVGNQILTERKRVIDVGGYDENLRASQDLDLWIRLVDKYGPIRRISIPLYSMDVSHDLARITTQSSSRELGTEQFIKKYDSRMSASQKKFRRNFFSTSRTTGSLYWLYQLSTSYDFSLSFEVIRSKLKIG